MKWYPSPRSQQESERAYFSKMSNYAFYQQWNFICSSAPHSKKCFLSWNQIMWLYCDETHQRWCSHWVLACHGVEIDQRSPSYLKSFWTCQANARGLLDAVFLLSTTSSFSYILLPDQKSSMVRLVHTCAFDGCSSSTGLCPFPSDPHTSAMAADGSVSLVSYPSSSFAICIFHETSCSGPGAPASGITAPAADGLKWWASGPPWSSTTLMSSPGDPGGDKIFTSIME